MSKTNLASVINGVWFHCGTLVIAGSDSSRNGVVVCNCADNSDKLTLTEAKTLAKYLATSHNTLIALAQKK